MQSAECESYWVNIYMAGDLYHARLVCRRYCLKGLCVTVQPQTFIYTGDEEAGIRVGLLPYPWLPSTPGALWASAEELAEQLRRELCQHSYLLQAPDRTRWVSRRDESPGAG